MTSDTLTRSRHNTLTYRVRLEILALPEGRRITNKVDIPFYISLHETFCPPIEYAAESIRHLLQDMVEQGYLYRVEDGVYERTAKEVSKMVTTMTKPRPAAASSRKPLHPNAQVLTKELFDELRQAKTIGPQYAFTIYPDVQEYMDSVSTEGYNRPIRPATVTKYAERMASGEWRLDGNAIMYDWNGQRINGQHRGEGCKQAQKPYAVYMSFGHDPEDYKTHDDVAKRTAGDLFSANHWSYPSKCAYAATWICRYLDGELKSRATIKPDHLFARAIHFGRADIEHAVKVGSAIERRTAIPAQYIAAVYYLARRVSPDAADSFFENWAKGGTAEPSVARKYANALAKIKRDSDKAVLDTRQVAMLIRAWNAFATGGNCGAKALTWTLESAVPVVEAATRLVKPAPKRRVSRKRT